MKPNVLELIYGVIFAQPKLFPDLQPLSVCTLVPIKTLLVHFKSITNVNMLSSVLSNRFNLVTEGTDSRSVGTSISLRKFEKLINYYFTAGTAKRYILSIIRK